MPAQKQILVIAGEESGDGHAARVVENLRTRLGAGWTFWGAGGEQLRLQGVELLADVRQLAAIGPVAALANLRAYWQLFGKIVERIRRQRPAVVLLVDFPEFNLRLARRARKLGIPVVYFISPQLWAWRRRRVRIVREAVDRMVVIFPFEQEFYRRHGVDAVFVGHPFAGRGGRAAVSRESLGVSGEKRAICLLPGSRRAEVERIFPTMLDALRLLAASFELEAVVVRAASIDPAWLQTWVDRYPDLTIHVGEGDAEQYLAASDFAMVKSGTATLLATLALVPFVAVYRVSPWSWALGKLLIRTPYYCISNLIAGREIVPELMQGDATAEKIAEVARRFLGDSSRAEHMRADLREVVASLGDGCAYERTAQIVYDTMIQRGGML